MKSDGSLWFTDPPWGLADRDKETEGQWVYSHQPDGTISVVTKDLAMPNGIVFSPDESRLYIADTGGHPKFCSPEQKEAPAQVYIFDVAADNTVTKRLEALGVRSDGMCVDVEGNVYTTTHDGIVIFDKDGKQISVISVPEHPANACFGGGDYKTLFITARKSLYSIRMKYAGAKPPGANW